MKKTLKAVGILAMIGGWPLALSALHAVHVPGQRTVLGITLPGWTSWHLVTKEHLTFRATFVDTRQWTLNDIADHAAVASRLERAGLGSAFAHVGTPEQIAAALRGEKQPEPAVEPEKDVVPAAPAEPASPGEPPKATAQQVAQPSVPKPDKDNIFNFD